MSGSTVEQAAAGPSAADQAAVAALTQQVIAAWARNDADGFADLFVEDGTMILPGLIKLGREEIRGYLTDAFAGPYQGTRVTGRPLGIRFLSPESGILLTQGGVLAPGETEISDAQTIHASWVVVKLGGDWRLAAYQNSPAHQMLPAPGSTGR
ncbi:SgcJ/EcaC family oxidoreductase [Streptomyces sp. V4-01]|uniref:SgcJ/EcaC family oxidoreductase n=1 Tax=Actinacidiphila polyblastidii TaxID=3110430 RepID=A0ABU7PFM7_9ACTN|nr:SgcJ/EcaC family oxidoreductase [Streptomyces sp. V4-01]